MFDVTLTLDKTFIKLIMEFMFEYFQIFLRYLCNM